ncbi:ABC1 kinase family protein [Heliophilum fasciatum]|uniref:Putative unusual protein kinase regulating ubiquinone biosynthesis (AarF/ABC1/UbiB family) n=1 Tax=Heliophilum fasciatum TaxID=35700 RepID=A0A4R2RVH9_9FIRM|nr:AarF/UbiB family protein [Heliophilum fasciatum]MCW2277064.1 putative unusual protein kinase regulating ubiquinone biosynthesis (AarF/ABC1/UbiB family) [Heliophilum fasciatum]TCP68410.1 putative unusual protein kinase regulating ubiquinone biosynthesis (AarF/ABC1/UbiB family) [Heliophilum fasciatum]
MNRYYRIWRITSMFFSFMVRVWWYKKREARLGQKAMEEQWSALFHRMALRFCQTSTEMGGLLIKTGQFFATRVDILPKAITEELNTLQDAVPAAPFEHIKQTIEAEFGRPLLQVFPQIEEQALAAASLGQVHRAWLPSGEKVAVKVLRPNINEIIQADFDAIHLTMWFAKKLTDIEKQMDLDAIYREMRQTFGDELDYRLEAGYADRFRALIAGKPGLAVPLIYHDYSTSRVLTMEFIEGRRIDDLDFLEENQIDRRELAKRLMQAYLDQVIVFGFYHADPHQGNLYVQADGTLVFLDFGMVGELTSGTKENIKDMLFALLQRDSEQLVNTLNALGFLRPNANRNLIRRAMEFFFQFHSPEQLKELEQTKNLGPLAADLRELVYDQPIQIPAYLIFVGRAVATVTGVAIALDPQIDANVAAPYLQKLLSNEDGTIGQEVWRRAKDYGNTLIGLPGLMSRTLKKADLGEIYVRVDNLGDIQRALQFQPQLVNRVTLAIMVAAMAICTTIFYTQHFYFEANWTGGLGIFFTLMLMWQSSRRPHNTNQPIHRNGPF